MTQQEFDELSEKYTRGQCTKEEIERLENWLDDVVSEPDPFTSTIPEDELLKAKLKSWYLIKSNISLAKNEIKKPWYQGQLVTSLVLLILLVGSWYFFQNNHSTTEEYIQQVIGVQSINAGNAPQKILLPDSSTVVLEAGASLVIDERFGEKYRTVQLKGGAFFSIKSNKQKPFLVHTEDLVTEVLGTSFSIQPKAKSNQIEVAVVTGKVSVYTNSKEADVKRDGVIISPNHKIVYDATLKKIRHDLVDRPQIIHHENENISFDFNETNLETALQIMQKSYGIEILVVNPTLKECKLTGNLNGIDMYSQLEFICEVLGASYELRGSTIFIIGNECS